MRATVIEAIDSSRSYANANANRYPVPQYERYEMHCAIQTNLNPKKAVLIIYVPFLIALHSTTNSTRLRVVAKRGQNYFNNESFYSQPYRRLRVTFAIRILYPDSTTAKPKRTQANPRIPCFKLTLNEPPVLVQQQKTPIYSFP